MKKLTLLTILGFLVSTLGLGASAKTWVFEPGDVEALGKKAFAIEEVYDFGAPSVIQYEVATGESNTRVEHCLELGVEPCTLDKLDNWSSPRKAGDVELGFALTMPVCESEAEDWCISSVRLYRQGEPAIPAKFVRSVAGNRTPAVPSHNIPAGGTTSIWAADEASDLNGLQVAVYGSGMFRNTPKFDPKTQEQTLSFKLTEFSLSVDPFISVSRPFQARTEFFEGPSASPGIGNWPKPTQDCLWEEGFECGEKIDHPKDLRIGISVRSKYEIGEFFNGRLSDPNLSVERQGKFTFIEVDANPVTVPQVGFVYEETAAISEKLGTQNSSARFFTRPFYDNAIKSLDVFRELAKDTASAENTFWRLSSIGTGGGNPCYAKYGLAGMVFTNATAFGGMSPPELKDGYLSYEVAGMHYLSDGQTEFEGTYDLLLRSEVARCLYGYSKAPVSANVTVVGTSGEQKVASTVVSEKDGWLKLAAYGFTFSENQVKVRLSQTKTKILSKFAGKTVTLSAKQAAELSRLISSSTANKAVTCSATYFKPAEQKLALARAKATCNFVSRLDPSRSTKPTVKKVSSQASAAKVIVTTK